MQVKTISAMTENGLDRKVNEFIKRPNIEIKDIQFQASFGMMYVLITYESK